MKKFFSGLLFSTILMASPAASLFAAHHHHHHNNPIVTFKSVAGTYQTNGFSNSVTPTVLQPAVAEAYVGQAVFNKDGTGNNTFVNYSISANNSVISVPYTNIPFTYTLGPVDGQGLMTITDFPAVGQTQTFAISFKYKNGKVKGFSLLTISTTTPGSDLWSLVQGKRVN